MYHARPARALGGDADHERKTMRLSTPRVLVHLRHLLLGCGVLTTFALPALAGPPHNGLIQAVLRDGAGNAITGTRQIVIRLYTQPSGGVPLASETRTVTVTEGLFDAQLDTLGNPDLYRGQNENWFFGVSVAGEVELTPRLRIATVPFAHASTSLNGDLETSSGQLFKVTLDGDALKEMILRTGPDSAMILLSDSSTVDGSMGRYYLRAGIPLRSAMEMDDDGDGTPDGEIENLMVPGSSSVAIKTKGTGADKNRVSSSVYADSTVEITTLATAGEGTVGIESKTKPKKGTVIVTTSMPSPGHTTLVRNSASEDTAACEVSMDATGDNDPEGEGSMIVTPGTSSVAIKTKGTGADPNRVVSTTYEDSTVQTMSLSTASTGTREINMRNLPSAAVVEAKNYPSPGHTTLTKGSAYADSATFVVSMDTTGDDDPEGEVSTFVTPGTCSVAIKTKGTGADKNKVVGTTSPDSAHVELSSGGESAISMSTKPTGVGTPGSSSLSLHHTSGGVTGTIQLSTDDFSSAINLSDDGLTTYRVSTSDGMQMMDNSGIAVTVIDRAGNAAFSNSVGVGVASPTHPIEHSSGAHLTAGGTWTNASDSNLKENFEEVDGAELLDQLARLPISQWNYKNEGASARHIGPTAQDFQKTFGVGSDGRSISTIDPSGIALAAIKELELRNQSLAQQNAQLQETLVALLNRVERLEREGAAR